MRIAVSGSTGFIGTALVRALVNSGHDVAGITRHHFQEPELLQIALDGVEAAIHLAGLAHRTGGAAPSAAEFEAVNAELPQRFYAAARDADLRRFVHVSTIAVLSGHTGRLTADLPPAPVTLYDGSKTRAEIALQSLAEAGTPELTIVRPPLVYGPGAKANLQSLMRLCDMPLPLPFGSVANRRSMIGLTNLVSALIFLATHEGSGIFQVTDGNDLSLADLVREIRKGLGRRPNLVPCPPALLRAALKTGGLERMAHQLLDDQQVDDSPIRALGWTPPHPPAFDLANMARAFAKARRPVS